ncbi:hypothetical protein HNY73_005776 [Argiope bruennichi]|uniref:Uncharacterized protein n=1 Tax=Argiope bruennichi TaxID=94029 RepID=A0A8T0FKA6_ARGBR|nr:hypothetical protein HNY73_005776 [Argiope bruennichi]
MAFLAKFRKVDLTALAQELGIEITPADRVVNICGKIKSSPNFDEKFVKNQLEVIVQERETAEDRARKAEAEEKARTREAEKRARTREAEKRARTREAEKRARTREAEKRSRTEKLKKGLGTREAEKRSRTREAEERAFELEKLRITSAAETISVTSNRSENNKHRPGNDGERNLPAPLLAWRTAAESTGLAPSELVHAEFKDAESPIYEPWCAQETTPP